MLGNHCTDLRVYLLKKWGFLYLIASMFSIEHFAVPNIDHIMVKSDGMEKSNIMQYLSFSLNEHVSFWICTYYSEKVATNFSLIENGDYLKVIACTPKRKTFGYQVYFSKQTNSLNKNILLIP